MSANRSPPWRCRTRWQHRENTWDPGTVLVFSRHEITFFTKKKVEIMVCLWFVYGLFMVCLVPEKVGIHKPFTNSQTMDHRLRIGCVHPSGAAEFWAKRGKGSTQRSGVPWNDRWSHETMTHDHHDRGSLYILNSGPGKPKNHPKPLLGMASSWLYSGFTTVKGD